MSWSKRIEKSIRYGTTAAPVVTFGVKKFKEWQTNKKYTITVSNDSDLYYVLESWIQSQLPEVEHRYISVAVKNRELTSFFDAEMEQTIFISGVPIRVSLTQGAKKKRGGENDAVPEDSSSNGYYTEFKKRKITMIADDLEGKKVIINQLKDLTRSFEAGTWLRVMNQWADWNSLGRVQTRPAASVILSGNTTKEILDDAKLFRKSKDRYDVLGIPWHRGYLFHGPPGSGKTSLAKMLAYELGMNLYYIPLSAIKNDADLGNAIARINENSILLMEDIDVVHAAKERNDDNSGVTLSGLLNALDGVITPPGLITILTTNNKEVLDPALIRAGRVDVDREIGYMTDTQINQLCEFLIGYNLGLSLKGEKITSSDVVEVFKTNLHDNHAIEVALLEKWG